MTVVIPNAEAATVASPAKPSEEGMNRYSRFMNPPPKEGPPRRGFPGQRPERVREQTARRHAVEVGLELAELGWQWNRITRFLDLPERTFRDWRADFQRDHLKAIPLGRPILAARREDRNELFHTLDELGPGIGVPVLQQMFPHLARAAIEDFVRRYRRVWRQRHYEPIRVLHWTKPGTVWALDFHGPRACIDGTDPYLLAVRDLSSGRNLLWLPVRDATAATAWNAIAPLFAEHGAPLVLKSDNGSAFIAAEFADKIREQKVRILYSPARSPQYNGSIEAGIGSLKNRTEQHAARCGHPGHWTWDDVAAATWEANATARPREPSGLTPDELWAARTPITEDERRLFGEAVDRALLKEIPANSEGESGWTGDQGEAMSSDRVDPEIRATQRRSIRSALVEQGLLYFTRKRIPLPIPRKKAAIIP